MNKPYLAVDLGAESGRVMTGILNAGKLTLEETARFPNGPVWFDGAFRWNLPTLYQAILQGLHEALHQHPDAVSVSVDAWGVDYVWSGLGQSMLSLPHQYRDPRVREQYQALREKPGEAAIYHETGIQFMPFNSLYQLATDLAQHRALLDQADDFLFIADWFHAEFCGERAVEPSIASTSQLYNPVTRDWSHKLVETLGFPARLLPKIVPSGTTLGRLTQPMKEKLGGDLAVVATCSHDTGAAVAAVPGMGDDWAYLSSGTWSLIGLELRDPLVNDEALAANVTNEIGFDHTVRLLKNITGLWILQECKRAWAAEGHDHGYAELNQAAESAEPLRTLIHPDHPPFLDPGEMPQKIVEYAKATGQPIPETPGQFTRCILESLALSYRTVLDKLASLAGRTVNVLHIVGGGSQSVLLNQFAANATGRKVVTGPVEATAIGNLLMQAVADGTVPDLRGLRAVVRQSFELTSYEPRPGADWEAALAKYQQLPISL